MFLAHIRIPPRKFPCSPPFSLLSPSGRMQEGVHVDHGEQHMPRRVHGAPANWPDGECESGLTAQIMSTAVVRCTSACQLPRALLREVSLAAFVDNSASSPRRTPPNLPPNVGDGDFRRRCAVIGVCCKLRRAILRRTIALLALTEFAFHDYFSSRAR